MTKKIIGISGKKRHGKDTSGKIIRALRPNTVTIAYADALKHEVASMIADYKVSQWFRAEDTDTDNQAFRASFITTLVNQMNDDTIDPKTGEATKEQYRLILQWWGTEFRRKMFVDSYWRDKLEEKLRTLDEETLVVVTDVRFPDEADQIKMLGGIVVRVTRPGMPDGGTHGSEVALDNYGSFDFYLNNDGPEHDYLTNLEPQIAKMLVTYGY